MIWSIFTYGLCSGMQLFQEFLRNSVGEMEEVARRVVDDLKAELDVRD